MERSSTTWGQRGSFKDSYKDLRIQKNTFIVEEGLINHLPKFEGIHGEDPYNHIFAFHDVCSLRIPLHHDFEDACARAFLFSLVNSARKWYLSNGMYALSWKEIQKAFVERYGASNIETWTTQGEDMYSSPHPAVSAQVSFCDDYMQEGNFQNVMRSFHDQSFAYNKPMYDSEEEFEKAYYPYERELVHGGGWTFFEDNKMETWYSQSVEDDIYDGKDDILLMLREMDEKMTKRDEESKERLKMLAESLLETSRARELTTKQALTWVEEEEDQVEGEELFNKTPQEEVIINPSFDLITDESNDDGVLEKPRENIEDFVCDGEDEWMVEVKEEKEETLPRKTQVLEQPKLKILAHEEEKEDEKEVTLTTSFSKFVVELENKNLQEGSCICEAGEEGCGDEIKDGPYHTYEDAKDDYYDMDSENKKKTYVGGWFYYLFSHLFIFESAGSQRPVWATPHIKVEKFSTNSIKVRKRRAFDEGSFS